MFWSGLMGAVAFVVMTGLLTGCAIPPTPTGCEADGDCDDGNVCTVDTCDTDAGTCSNTPTAEAVIVSASASGDAVPGGTVTVTADAQVCDAATTITGYSWAQSNSVAVTISSANAATTDVVLPGASAYKDELIHVLMEPPVTQDQLPDTVEIPEGEFPGGLPDRVQVVGINPFALEETGHVALMVTVSTSSGDFTAQVDVHTELPFKTASGIRNVPLGIPVLLHATSGAGTYDWALAAASGSGATLTDATTQSPYFTPDVAGVYTVTVTDGGATKTLEIYAGPWTGAITGQDADGRPEAAGCTGCHNGGIAPDKFTPWAQTGHAEIFSDNLDTSTHYGESCFACHTVGFDTGVDNGGADDADDYDAFLGAGLLNMPGDNWTTMLADFPHTAQLANIQCENCHGPQGSSSHMQKDGSRITLSSDMCGVCHGEPLRHARFQQWQLSGHANYELAVDEGTNGSCAKCHTANGFLAWLPALLDGDPTNDNDNVDATAWTVDEIHPQTCTTCHDPHAVGSVTGEETDARMRIYGDTPLLAAGFTVTDVGNAALCMTCHNSRRGLKNDTTWDGTDIARAPHGAAQTDVLMGQNAYLVTVGTAGAHSMISDSCVQCHMEATPPPDSLAYQLGGTNHTFFASPEICADCHVGIMADAIQGPTDTKLDTLEGLIEAAILNVMSDQIAAGNSLQLTLEDDSVVTITDAATIDTLQFADVHGRQGVQIVLTDGTDLGGVRLPDVRVIDATDTDLGELYDFASEALAKSGWNWILVSNDGSHGVHNPSFVGNVLDASITALTP